MTIVIALKTNTHLLICSQTTLASSIIKIKDTHDYVTPINGVLTAIVGDQGDSFRTASFLQEYSKMLSLKYKEKITPQLIARIFSTEIHDSIRTRRMEVQGLVGGRDEDNLLRLFGVDQYGAVQEDDFIVTGY